MLDVANTYLRMWSKLEYVDVWYSVPQPEDASRVSSQLWHRDYNDKHLLKAFLYLVDVDEEMGPFQYIPGSHPGGQYADAWPWKPLGKNYPTEGELEQRIPASAIQSVHRPEGVARVLQHVGLSSRRVLDDRSARAGDRDILVARIARVADGAELRLRGLARRARRCLTVRTFLKLSCELSQALDSLNTVALLCLFKKPPVRTIAHLTALMPEVEQGGVRAAMAAAQAEPPQPDGEGPTSSSPQPTKRVSYPFARSRSERATPRR